MADVLYTAVATARGGRQGEVVSDDGILDLMLHTPVSLGGPEGEYTNPEQLFAAGYSACFGNAILSVGQALELDLSESTVTAEVSLGRTGTGVGIAVALTAHLPGLDAGTAQKVVDAAHERCPYSKATRGNIDVTVTVA